MKRKILSLLLVFAMLFSVVSLTGCKTDDLEVAVNENAAKADTAVANAATKAAEELAAAKAALEEALASGDKANADKLTAAINDLNAAIEAAKKAATDADDALNAEIEAAIEAAAKASADNLDAAKAALEAADASNATAINKATAELNAAIEAAKETAANADAALKTELEGKISSNLNKLAGQISTNLNNTKKSLQKLIEEGDAENADALAEAVDALNASIELAKTAAASADADLKAELTAAINAAVKSVSDAAAANLKAAVEKLEAADKADADALAEAVKTLNAAIETVKTTANNANTGLKTELEKAIAKASDDVADAAAANLEKAVKDLNKLIADGDSANIEALASTKTNLQNQIDAVKAICDTLTGSTAVADLETKLTAAIDAVAAAAMKLEAWDDTTDALITTILAELDAKYKTYTDRRAWYGAEGFVAIEKAYSNAKIRLMRAATIDQANAIVTDFVDDAEVVPSVTDTIYNKIVEVKDKIAELEAYIEDDAELLYTPEAKAILDEIGVLLDEAYDLIDDVLALQSTDLELYRELMADLTAYECGEGDTHNLIREYNAYKAAYEEYVEAYYKLEQIYGGRDIKADMDELLADYITLDDEDAIDALRVRFDNWIGYADNALADVEGFADTYAMFEAAEARIEALKDALVAAEALNDRIATLDKDVLLNGGTKTNGDALKALTADVNAWIDLYFADDYAGEIDVPTVNYTMVEHDYLADVQANYDNAVEAFRNAAQNFIDALAAVPQPINILGGTKLQAALEAYDVWVYEARLGNFDYDLTGGKTPADYVGILQQLEADYDIIVRDALADWNALYPAVESGLVTIYNTQAVADMLGWYETYGVKEGENFVFEDGYVLSATVTVTEADYNALIAMKTEQDALVEAKVAETQAVIDAIDAIGTVTTNRADYIAEVRAAYDAWLAVGDVQKAIDLEDDTYVVTNYEVLVNAEVRLADLLAEIAAIHDAIEALDAKVSYVDFNDDRDAYEVAIAEIRAAIAAFKANNNGDLEGNVSDAEEAKLVAGELAIAKFDAIVRICDAVEYNANNSLVAGDFMTAMFDVLVDAKTAIDAIDDIMAVDGVAKYYEYKIAAIVDAYATYVDYVEAVAADTELTDRDVVETKLANEAARFINRMLTMVETEEDVDLTVENYISGLANIYTIV